MKILQINKFYHPWLGGVESVVQNIAEGLDKKGDLEISVLACQPRGPRRLEKINGITVYRAASFGRFLGMPLSLDFFRLLKTVIRDYDAVIIHHPFPLAFLSWPLLKDKKIFIWYHSDIVRQKFSRLLFQPALKSGLEKADKIFVGSEKLIQSSPLLKKYASKCTVIPFGLDLDYFTAQPEITASAKLIKETYGAPLILSVGRLVPYKGLAYLIKAWPSIKLPAGPKIGDGPKAKLLIIGSGPEEKRLRSLIKKLDLEDQIRIIKPVPDLRPFYAASDLFVLPSITANEAFGLVQIEAMAFGKPIINTRLMTGVTEVSPHLISGLTAAPRDPASLAAAINKLLSDPELKKSLGEEARRRVETIFNKDEFRKRLSAALLAKGWRGASSVPG